ncbi:hypothetical protein ACFLS1_01120 [Verrucomicrobiota bacterium]
MKSYKKPLFIISVCLICPLVMFAADKGKSSLTSAKAIFAGSLNKIKAEYTQKAISWPVQYQKALTVLLEKTRESGDLEGWVAVDKEVKRFEKNKELPKKAIVEKPASLRSLQKTYFQASSGLEIEKSKEILDLTEKYITHLTGMQKDLTKQGKIEEAIEIKKEADSVKSHSDITVAEFTIAEYEAQHLKPEEATPKKKTPPGTKDEPEKLTKKEQRKRDREARETSSKPQNKKSDFEIYDSRPPKTPDIHFAKTSFKPTKTARLIRKVSCTVMQASTSDTKSTSHSDYSIYKTQSGVISHFVRLELRSTSSDITFENPRIVVQYFSKPVGAKGKIKPTEAEKKTIKLEKISSDRIYIDFSPVSFKKSSSQYVSSYYYDYASSSTKSGLALHGVIISIFNEDGSLLFQGTSNNDLDLLAVTEAAN